MSTYLLRESSKKLLGEAIPTYSYIINTLSSRTLENKSPVELLNSCFPSLQDL